MNYPTLFGTLLTNGHPMTPREIKVAAHMPLNPATIHMYLHQLWKIGLVEPSLSHRPTAYRLSRPGIAFAQMLIKEKSNRG